MEKPYSGYSTYASWFEVLGWLGDQWLGLLGQLAFRMISWPEIVRTLEVAYPYQGDIHGPYMHNFLTHLFHIVQP